MMLQLYSQPFLAYGIGSLILSHQRAWSEIRTGLISLAIFGGAELIASLRFAAFLNGPPLAVAVWFAWFMATTAFALMLTWQAVWSARALKLSLWEQPALTLGLKGPKE